MNNPFDLENYKSQICLKDIAFANKCSRQQTAVVNRKRMQGVEPTAIHLPGSQDVPPQKFAVKMPTIPKYNQNEARKAKRAEKKAKS